MKILVSTCDRYAHLLKGFALQFNKYWGPDQEVHVLGFTPVPDLPPNFRFRQLAEVERQPWSTHMRNFLAMCADPYFVFLFDDYWLRAPVDREAVARMEGLMQQPDVVKADLSRNTEEFAHAPYADGLVQALPDARYRTSTQPCIWRRSFMSSLMKPGLNPWAFELQPGPEKSKGVIVGGTAQIFDYANVYLKGRWNWAQVQTLPESDRAMLVRTGALPVSARPALPVHG